MKSVDRESFPRCFLLALLVALALSSSALAAEKPNVLLVMADDLGWGDVAYNGNEMVKTPNLDAMSLQGFRFDRFYAAAPVCSPTRASVMTGRHPNRMGCFQWGHTLRPQEVTLAEVMKKAGYRTGHFGKWHLGSVRKGSPVNPGASGFDTWLSAPNFYDNNPILSRQGKAVQTQGESSIVAADAAIDFMKRAVDQQKPFFAVVWFGSPHRPHDAFPEHRGAYVNETEKLQNLYGEITGLDQAVGKLRASIRDLGVRNNTVFWFCSDNGALPEGNTGGFRGHKGDVYEGGFLVPAILEWPDQISKPGHTQVRCNTSDIFPTVLEMAGIEGTTSHPLDGMSLVPVMEGQIHTRKQGMGFWDYPIRGISTPSKAWMKELWEAQEEGNELKDDWRLRLDAGKISEKYPMDSFPGHSAWIHEDWKIHRMENRETGAVTWELYNLKEDPKEQENLVLLNQRKSGQLKAELERWLKSVVASLNGEDYR